MTNKSDYGTKKCIDYIFSDIKPSNVCLRYFSEENLENRKKWQQPSDHIAIHATFEIELK